MTGASLYRAATYGFAGVFIAIGVAMIVVTAIHGGGVGFLLGALFVALGAGRLYLLAQR